MKRTFVGTALGLVFTSVFSFAASFAAAQTVRIGIQNSPAVDIIAKQLGYAEEMVDAEIEYVNFDSGRDAILAVGSNSVDMVLVGSSPSAFGLSSGVEGEVAYVFHLIAAGESLVCSEASGATTLEDLAGKTLAVPFGSTTHYDMLQALASVNLSEGDVTLLDLQPNDMVGAFERGDIDCGWVWYPALQSLYDAGGVSVTDAGQMAELGFPTSDLLIVSKAYGEENPETVAQYVAALDRAVTLVKDDMPAAVQALVAEFGLSADEAETALSTLTRLPAAEQLSPDELGTSDAIGGVADALYNQAQFLASQGLTEKALEPDFYKTVVNPSYLELAEKDGYIK